jgi:predicted dienelactone hydrolase
VDKSKYLFVTSFWIAIVLTMAIATATGHYRWQLLPVFGASIVVSIGLLVLPNNSSIPLLFPGLVGTGIVGVLVSAILSYYYPIFTFPVPTGRYAVGTTTIDLLDNSRTELCDPSTTSSRELVVRVWYPAIAINAVKSPYLEDARLIPSGVFSHLGAIVTNAVRDAPMVATAVPFPVVIYSPSWGGFKTDNTFGTEELASHGFVAIGLEHPCSVPIALYPNGRVIYSNLSADYTSSDAAMTKFLSVAAQQLALRTQDVRFILDRLPQIAANRLFTGNLDLDKIGIFGHSFGGAVAAQACAIDPRLKAGLNMDGLLFGSAAKLGAKQPFLFMNSDYPRPTAADLHSPNGTHRRSSLTDEWGFGQRERWLRQHGGYNLTIRDATHANFSDAPLKSRINNGGGKIAVDRAMRIINAYTVAFFDRELKGHPSPLLGRQSGSPFPEVTFERSPRA